MGFTAFRKSARRVARDAGEKSALKDWAADTKDIQRPRSKELFLQSDFLCELCVPFVRRTLRVDMVVGRISRWVPGESMNFDIAEVPGVGGNESWF